MDRKDLLYIFGMLGSIAFAVGFILVGIPYLVNAFDAPWIGWSVVIFVVPAVPVISEILQQERKFTVFTFFAAYVSHTIGLLLELLFIVIIIPVIAFQLTGILMGLMLFALTILLAGHTSAYFFGWPSHMLAKGNDFWVIFGLWAGGIVIGILYILAIKAAKKREEKFYDVIRKSFDRIKKMFTF